MGDVTEQIIEKEREENDEKIVEKALRDHIVKQGKTRQVTTTDRGRYYVRDAEPDVKYRSVTTFLNGGIPKPALIPWAAKMGGEFAVANWSELSALMAEGDEQEVIKRISGAHRAARDAAGDIGSRVHDYIEKWVLAKADESLIPELAEDDPVRAYFEDFKRWVDEYEVDFEIAECRVFNRTHRYAGTLDAIANVSFQGKDGPRRLRLLLDWKTSKKGPYVEVEYQLAAYRYAEFIDVGGEEIEMPEVDGAACLRIVPGNTQLFAADASEAKFDLFLAAAEVAGRDTKKYLLDIPMNAPVSA